MPEPRLELPEREFLDIAAVAVLYETSPSALYAQRHRGEAPGILGVRVGRRLLWRRSDLDGWFDSQVASQAAAMAVR